MYDVDMDAYDEVEHTAHAEQRKRTLSEHEAVVEHQLKRLKINPQALSPAPSSDDDGRDSLDSAPPQLMEGLVDVNYAYVNQLLREMHYLRQMRKRVTADGNQAKFTWTQGNT
ncbi:Aste57867_9506 [Aphanomyces stellatus]|uniref:Aste57867_9506 protein n=1 Tax=Aphanomyces stellatus TaxID=120398 RepID=A0A485KNE8_9STRA|nr:hypothetical protein As57867_009469 [Aphanomyces stellatus]VFT86385.1 Aste57867_9506 [Aphanomyces stellatus]